MKFSPSQTTPITVVSRKNTAAAFPAGSVTAAAAARSTTSTGQRGMRQQLFTNALDVVRLEDLRRPCVRDASVQRGSERVTSGGSLRLAKLERGGDERQTIGDQSQQGGTMTEVVDLISSLGFGGRAAPNTVDKKPSGQCHEECGHACDQGPRHDRKQDEPRSSGFIPVRS